MPSRVNVDSSVHKMRRVIFVPAEYDLLTNGNN
jgi:hypothetical protein